jgi:hypothetical protein
MLQWCSAPHLFSNELKTEMSPAMAATMLNRHSIVGAQNQQTIIKNLPAASEGQIEKLWTLKL